MAAPAACAAASRIGVTSSPCGIMAWPPGSSPWKIEAFSAAMPSSEPNASICAGATVVIIATCGRAMRDSGAISPGWFMPSSTMAKSVSAGIRASVSGTPQWLFRLASAAWTRPSGASAAAAMSLVEVLPTEPVIASTRARVRARAARPNASSAGTTSATSSSGASGGTPSGMRLTSAAAAPLSSACATKSWPSRASFSATNRSPGRMVRVSMEIPSAAQSAVARPPVAAAASCAVHSVISCHPARPRPPRPVPHRQRETHPSR